MVSAKGRLRELALFAGAGGGILGGHLLGWRTVCAVEIEDYPRKVLLARQRDKILKRFPIWDDITTFDGQAWQGRVDVVSGGFPCQDISCAGKGEGLGGSKSGLWTEMARVISEVQPPFVFVENSPLLTIRGLCTVLGDLSTLGYDARWGVLGGEDVGIPVRRKRIWILACPNMWGMGERRCTETITKESERRNSNERNSRTFDAYTLSIIRNKYRRRIPMEGWYDTQPKLLRALDDMAPFVDRHKAIGNGQVPAVAALAWNILTEGLD